jgi:hypothetical protein
VLIGRAKLQALAPLRGDQVHDIIGDSVLIDPSSGYFHRNVMGTRGGDVAEDLLLETHPAGRPLQTGDPCPTRSVWVRDLERVLHQTDRVA